MPDEVLSYVKPISEIIDEVSNLKAPESEVIEVASYLHSDNISNNNMHNGGRNVWQVIS